MITIYTDVDSIFDTRRGIIEHVIKESGNREFTWDMYEDIYKNRTMDYFDKPDIGLTHEAYQKRFSQRCVEDWVDEENEHCYFYPSNVLKFMLPSVRAIEWGSTQLIQVSEISLDVNIYPFDMSEELQTDLIGHIKNAFKININVNLISANFESQTASLINNYNYVFRYGHLINPELEAWHKTYLNSTLLGTKIFVPELLAQAPSDDPVLETLNNDSIKNRISNINLLQQGKVIFMPIDKSVFDSCI